jgi:glycosyltransferase involved in cell wall biosynthesis
MKVCLVDSRKAPLIADGVATYVGSLTPALAEDHRVTIVTVQPGLLYLPGTTAAIQRTVERDRPDVLHIHNLVGLELAAILWAVSGAVPVALTLHDDQLLRLPAAINQWLTGSVGLVISRDADRLERHLRYGLFRRCLQEVLPYGSFYDMRFHSARLASAYRRLIAAHRTGGLDRAA